MFRKAALQIADQLSPTTTEASPDSSERESAGIETVAEPAATPAPAEDIVSSTAATPPPKIVVNCENLEKYVGRPKFTSDRMYDRTPPGVSSSHLGQLVILLFRSCFCG